MSNLYIICFQVEKNTFFLECLYMNLNFKLFLFFFNKAQTYFERKKLCKYLIYFISRKQKDLCVIMALSDVVD